MFIINEQSIKEARAVIEKKKVLWEKSLDVKFDKDGRASLGILSQFSKESWDEAIPGKCSALFNQCFKEGLRELRIEEFDISKIKWDEYSVGTITVTKVNPKTGAKSTQVQRVAKLLNKAHLIWEKKLFLYRDTMNHMKDLRKDHGPDAVSGIQKARNNFEKGNIYIAYDKLLRENQPSELIISINPLDKLFSSGSGSNHITKFESCWATRLDTRDSNSIIVEKNSCYSGPRTLAAIGEHPAVGMVIIKNGKQLKCCDMTFFGMLQRSHIWLNEGNIFIENIYPDKYNLRRLNEIKTLVERKAATTEVDKWTKLSFDDSDFDKTAWIQKIKTCVSYDGQAYLDRSAIDRETGDVYINKTFRYYTGSNHSTAMFEPRSYSVV